MSLQQSGGNRLRLSGAGIGFSGVLLPVLSVLTAFAVCGILISTEGINPLDAYVSLFVGAFGGTYAVTETLVKTAPLLFTSLGVSVAFTCKVWNIGAEGQLYMGAVASTWVALTFSEQLGLFVIPLAFLISFIAGAFWASVAGALKAKFGVNEIVTTLMLNYIAIYFVNYLLEGPWRDPSGITYSPPLPLTSRFPYLIEGTRLHIGVLLAFLFVPIIYLLLRKTIFGYEIRCIGNNLKAAKYGGIGIPKCIILVMIISGGLSGLAGMGEIYGIQHRMIGGLSPGYGFLAVLVALLGKLNPIGIVLAAFLYGALLVGGDMMQRSVGVPVTIVFVLQALIVIIFVGFEKIWRKAFGGK